MSEDGALEITRGFQLKRNVISWHSHLQLSSSTLHHCNRNTFSFPFQKNGFLFKWIIIFLSPHITPQLLEFRLNKTKPRHFPLIKWDTKYSMGQGNVYDVINGRVLICFARKIIRPECEESEKESLFITCAGKKGISSKFYLRKSANFSLRIKQLKFYFSSPLPTKT